MSKKLRPEVHRPSPVRREQDAPGPLNSYEAKSSVADYEVLDYQAVVGGIFCPCPQRCRPGGVRIPAHANSHRASGSDGLGHDSAPTKISVEGDGDRLHVLHRHPSSVHRTFSIAGGRVAEGDRRSGGAAASENVDSASTRRTVVV